VPLADRTNGRADATVLRPSVCLSSAAYVLRLNGASYRKTVKKQTWKRFMENRMVTWPMASSNTERSRSWPQYV